MVTIKNTNPQRTALNVGGLIVKFGAIVDVNANAAESLTASPNFKKASLADAKAAKEKPPTNPQNQPSA